MKEQVIKVKRKKKATPKKLARRRKKNGLEGLLEAILEAASAALRLYRKAKSMKHKPERKTKNEQHHQN